MPAIIIGIDVAKDSFEAAFLEARSGEYLQQHRYPNDDSGYERLLDEASNYDQSHAVLEATGTYHTGLAMALHEADLKQSIINPLQAKRFAEMKLSRAKTDAVDARLLAAYGREQDPPEHTPPEAAQRKLKQINTLIEQLTKQRTALKNVRHAADQLPESASVCDDVTEKHIQQLDKDLERLEKEQERLARSQFSDTFERAESVKGIGARTASVLVAYAGDLSGFDSHKQLTAFMGLDPTPRQSGTSLDMDGAISKKGHARLRSLFYMAAQSARRYNNTCRLLYDRLIERGKEKKVALIAVANKLIKQVFAVVKNQTMFDNNYHKKAAHCT